MSVPLSLAHIKFNSLWKKNGITVVGGNGAGSSANQLNNLHGLFVDDDQNLYIPDYHNYRIVEWKAGATCGRVVAGGNGQGSRVDQLNYAHDVIVDTARDCLFIADMANHRVLRWPLRGTTCVETIFNVRLATFLAIDEQGFLYVTSWLGHEVKRWLLGEAHGTVVTGGNGIGSRLNQLNCTRKVFVDQLGTVYIADRNNHRIMRWPKGAAEGEILVGGIGAGSASNQLNEPVGLFFDRHGNLFVSDLANHRVQKFEIY